MQWNLKINNIGGLQGEHNYTFGEGLNIVNAPNATGKSSAINALRLAMGGGQTGDVVQYINDSSEYAEVSLEDGETHRISLSRSGDTAEVLSRETPYDNMEVDDLAFLTEDSTLHDAVVEGDEEQVGSWMSNITDIEYYEIARDRARSVMQRVTRQKKQAEEQVKGSTQEVEELIDELENDLEEVTNEIDEILSSEEYEDIKSELGDEQDRKNELKDETGEVNRKISQLQTEVENARRTLKSKQEEKEELSSQLDELKKERTQGEEKIKDLRERVDELDDRISELKRELKGKREERDGRTITIEEGIKTRLKNKERRLERRQGIEGFNECPHCGQTLDNEEVRQEIEELQQEIEDLRNAKKQRQRQTTDLQAERQNILDNINEIREEIPERIDSTEKELRGVRNTISNKETEIENKQEEIESLKQERKSLNKSIEEVEERITELASKNEENQERLSNFYQQEKEIRNRLEQAQERKAKYQRGTERLEELQKKEQVAEQIVKHFSERIERVNVQMLGELNDALEENFELLELADFEKIRVERNRSGGFSLDLTRLDDKGRATPTTLAELSGAEKRLVAMLIQYVAKKTFAPAIPFFVVDEVSNAMDDERFRRVVKKLSEDVETLIVTRNTPYEGEEDVLSQEHISDDVSAVEATGT